ncbi:hypothetical protein LD39_19010 [Halobacillus sp. BBL2006]|nr:hypothetical protein LD39_19010 [Halobacillus sp. BBL2006]
MLDVWFLELAKALGRMFTQPFLYIAVGMVLLLSQRRLKQERKSFGIRIFDRFSEWKGTIGTSVIAGLCLSVFSIGAGLELSFPFLMLLSAVLLLVSVPMKLNWYSAAYTLGITYLVLLVLPYLPENTLFESWITTLEDTPLTSIAIILTVMLFVESILLLRTSPDQTFPERVKGSRGMWVGQHRSRKMAIVPFIALFPAGDIETFASWWPLLDLGGENFGLIVVPFVTGWEWIAKGQSPETAAKTMGRHTFLMALIVLIFVIGSFFIPALSLAAVVISLLGRELIHVLHRMREERPSFFSSNPKGLRILGVIPGSPAAQMGLIPGELIERVNTRKVRTENQFYEALQLNGGFNKIEVRDKWGENRYVQRALYEGEHFELGLVFVEPPIHETTVGFFG